MESMTEFFRMGGHAAYIWPAYGASLLVLFVLLFTSLRALKNDENTLRILQAENGGRRRRPAPQSPDLHSKEPDQEDAS